MSRRAAAPPLLRPAMAAAVVVLLALFACFVAPTLGAVSPRVRGFSQAAPAASSGVLEAHDQPAPAATKLHRTRIVDPAELQAHQPDEHDAQQTLQTMEYTTPRGQRVIIEQQAPSSEHTETSTPHEGEHVQQLLAHSSQAYLVTHGGVELDLATLTEADIKAMVASGQLTDAEAAGFFDSLKKKASDAASALKAKVAPALDSLKEGAKNLGKKLGAGLKAAAKSAASALKEQANKQLQLRKERIKYQQEGRKKPAFLKKYETTSTGPDPLRRRRRTPEETRAQETRDAELMRGPDPTHETTMDEMIEQAHEQWAGSLPALRPTAPKKLGAYVVSSTGAGLNMRQLGENLALAGANALNNWLN